MLNIVIFGAPGCGKGTQSELVAEKYDLFQLSTGSMLRMEIEKQTELGKSAEKYIRAGQLLPDDLIINMLVGVLEANPDEKGFIFDGFPRTLAQAESLDHLLRKANKGIIACFSLDVEEEILIERMLKRGEAQGRSDDTPDTIRKRLEIYQIQTESLIAYYKKQGKLFKIKGSKFVDDVFDDIREILDQLIFQK